MSPPSTAKAQAATLQKFIEGWEGWTVDGFMETWTDDCTQQNLPFSGGAPQKSRADAAKLFPFLMSFLTNFKVKIHNIVHDVANSKACIYALTTADTPVGPYANEHSIFIWFTESGEKVYKIEEMFDNIVMKEFLPKIHEYVAQQKAKSAA